MPAPDWPTDDELAAKLGLRDGDDVANVASANAAAAADAVAVVELDATTPGLDAGQFEAVLGLGCWWYQDRNRQIDVGSMGLGAITSPSRTRMLQILARGRVSIA